MALILGTDAYITLEDYKAYADKVGYSYGADAEVEQAIVIASYFIDDNYEFKGDAVDENQPLQLPTDDVVIADIERGVAEAVNLQIVGRLYVDPVSISQKGVVTSESKAVGSLSTSTSYAEGYSYTNTYPTPRVDKALSKFTVASGLGVVVRG